MAKIKFDIGEIVNNVKAFISPVSIPEDSQSNPISYLLGELSKTTKELADLCTKQADAIAKITNMLGALHQEVAANKKTESGGEEKLEGEKK